MCNGLQILWLPYVHYVSIVWEISTYSQMDQCWRQPWSLEEQKRFVPDSGTILHSVVWETDAHFTGINHGPKFWKEGIGYGIVHSACEAFTVNQMATLMLLNAMCYENNAPYVMGRVWLWGRRNGVGSAVICCTVYGFIIIAASAFCSLPNLYVPLVDTQY